MKKAMLFIVALLFSVSASAASLTMENVSNPADIIKQVIPSKVGATADQLSGEGFITREYRVKSDTDTFLRVELGPNVLADVTSWSYDFCCHIDSGTTLSTNLVVIMSVVKDTWYKLAYDLDFKSAGNFATLTVSEVPVPAALFLFAPALLGFLGLRRKAVLAA